MDHGTHGPPGAPSGDIGNHIVPKFIVVFAGIIGTIAVSVRLFARYSIKKLGVPDVLLVISMVYYCLSINL